MGGDVRGRATGLRRWAARLVIGALLGGGAIGPAAAGEFEALEGHGGPVMGLALSADGGQALTGSFDNSVGLWDLGGGAPIWLEGHRAAVKTVIFAGEGRIASGGDDFAIQVWDRATGQTLHRLEGHQGQVAALAVSPDGRELVSASWDGSVRLWDLETGAELGALNGHDGVVNDVAFAEGGAKIYSASADGTIQIWDRKTLAFERVVVRHGFGVNRFQLNEAAGWLLYGALDGGLRALSLETGETLADLTQGRKPILAIAISRDGAQAAIGDGEGYIMVVETEGWGVQHDFRAAKRGPIWALAYDAGGGRLLASGIEDAAFFWPIGQKSDGPLLGGEERAFLKDPNEMPNGERQFQRKCSICHSVQDDGVRRAGPTLAGVFGRKAGALPGYAYSEMMRNSEIVWSEATIDKLFDLGPDHYVPGSKMPMQRIVKAADRADLIEYLKRETGG